MGSRSPLLLAGAPRYVNLRDLHRHSPEFLSIAKSNVDKVTGQANLT
jgi:hypothetical protein